MVLRHLSDSLRNELVSDILPFWEEKMTAPDGGFHGRMDGHAVLHPDAERGGHPQCENPLELFRGCACAPGRGIYVRGEEIIYI